MNNRTVYLDLPGRCKDCRFIGLSQMDPMSIQKQAQCWRNPPQMVAQPGHKGQIGIMVTFPPVAPEMGCHSFEPLPPTQN